MKFLLSIALALGVAFVAYAAAASMTVNSSTLQVGSDSLACQTSDVTVDAYNAELNLGTFDQFKVKNIDAECGGDRVIVRIYDANDNEICSNSATQDTTLVPVGGGEVTVTLNTPCSIADAEVVEVLFQTPSI